MQSTNQPQPQFNMGVFQGKPWYFCKWWMRCSISKLENDQNGYIDAARFYVPIWAYPLELIHRMIFGFVKIYPIKEYKDKKAITDKIRQNPIK